MRKYDILNEITNPEQIIKQYEFTTAIDSFIITITKEPTQHTYNGKESPKNPKYTYNCYVNREDYGLIHFIAGMQDEDIEALLATATGFIETLERQIAEGSTDC